MNFGWASGRSLQLSSHGEVKALAGESSAMGKNVGVAPAHEVEPDPHRQERETLDRELEPALALQHRVEFLAHGMQMQDVGGGVSELRLAQIRRAPIRGLLLFR